MHRVVEGPVADDRMFSFPPALLLLAGDVSCGAAVAGRGVAGAEHGRGPQPAVWRGAAVLRRRWPPSPCRGAAVDCFLLLGGGGWCCCGAATHAARSVADCIQNLAIDELVWNNSCLHGAALRLALRPHRHTPPRRCSAASPPPPPAHSPPPTAPPPQPLTTCPLPTTTGRRK